MGDRRGSNGTAEAARNLLVRREALARARATAEGFIGTRASGLSAEASRAYRALLRPAALSSIFHGELPEPMRAFLEAARFVSAAETETQTLLDEEFAGARGE